MRDQPDGAALAAELEVFLARAGLTVPPDRKAALLAGFKEMRRQAGVVRSAPLAAELEPSNVFSLAPYVKER